MALHWLSLNKFEDVEKHYDSIKPIRGSDNIRPIGDRARKWEHIVKVNKNKYVICDTLWTDDVQCTWHEDRAGMIKRAALTWTRTKDGEFFTVRNRTGAWAHTSRYTFLDRVLPQGMYCSVEYGKQYIVNRDTDERQFLPKSRWINERAYDRHKQTSASMYWHAPNYVKRDDKTHVTYKRCQKISDVTVPTYAYMCVEGNHKIPVKRVRVNKEAKKPYLPAIKEFVEWAWDMRPIIEHSIGDWSAMSQYHREAGECIHNHEAFKRMLSDPESKYRVPVLADMLNDMCSWDWSVNCRQLTTDPTKFRQALNTRINRMGGFNITTDEFKEVQ